MRCHGAHDGAPIEAARDGDDERPPCSERGGGGAASARRSARASPAFRRSADRARVPESSPRAGGRRARRGGRARRAPRGFLRARSRARLRWRRARVSGTPRRGARGQARTFSGGTLTPRTPWSTVVDADSVPPSRSKASACSCADGWRRRSAMQHVLEKMADAVLGGRARSASRRARARRSRRCARARAARARGEGPPASARAPRRETARSKPYSSPDRLRFFRKRLMNLELVAGGSLEIRHVAHERVARFGAAELGEDRPLFLLELLARRRRLFLELDHDETRRPFRSAFRRWRPPCRARTRAPRAARAAPRRAADCPRP